jgi:hypothetical protein
VPADKIARIQRMEGANQNGNEALPLWMTAVVRSSVYTIAHERSRSVVVSQLAGVYAGLDNRTMNLASIALYVVSLSDAPMYWCLICYCAVSHFESPITLSTSIKPRTPWGMLGMP